MKKLHFLLLSSYLLTYAPLFSSEIIPEGDEKFSPTVTYKLPENMGGDFNLPDFSLSAFSKKLLSLDKDQVKPYAENYCKEIGEDAFVNKLERVWADLDQLKIVTTAYHKINIISATFQNARQREKEQAQRHANYQKNITDIVKKTAEEIASKMNQNSAEVQRVLNENFNSLVNGDEESLLRALKITSSEGIFSGIRTLIASTAPALKIQHTGLEASKLSISGQTDLLVGDTIEKIRKILNQRKEKLTQLQERSRIAESIGGIQ